MQLTTKLTAQLTTRLRRLALLFSPLFFASTAQARFPDVCYEDFKAWQAGVEALDGHDAGGGWLAQWFSGSPEHVVTGGDFFEDGYAHIAGNDQPAVRVPNPFFWNSSVATSGLEFATDGSSMWFSFRSRRMPGGTPSDYGGLSLASGTEERAFIGCCAGTGAWGVQSPGQLARTVPGASVDEETLLVTRIDYRFGDERLRLWINPTEAQPDSPPNLDTTVSDHRWDAIRFQAGGGTSGFGFDDLTIGVSEFNAPPDLELSTPVIVGSNGVPLAVRANFAPYGHADDLYVVMCGMSGAGPGTPLPPHQIPLNLDSILVRSIANPMSIGLSNSIGTVPFDGTTVVQHQLPTSLPETIDLWYAFLLFDPVSQNVTKVSDPSSACTVIYF